MKTDMYVQMALGEAKLRSVVKLGAQGKTSSPMLQPYQPVKRQLRMETDLGQAVACHKGGEGGRFQGILQFIYVYFGFHTHTYVYIYTELYILT